MSDAFKIVDPIRKATGLNAYIEKGGRELHIECEPGAWLQLEVIDGKIVKKENDTERYKEIYNNLHTEIYGLLWRYRGNEIDEVRRNALIGDLVDKTLSKEKAVCFVEPDSFNVVIKVRRFGKDRWDRITYTLTTATIDWAES